MYKRYNINYEDENEMKPSKNPVSRLIVNPVSSILHNNSPFFPIEPRGLSGGVSERSAVYT